MLRSSRMTASKNSSVSFCMAARSGSSKVGKLLAVGADRLEVADLQPLVGEVLDQRLGLGVAKHPPDLRLEVVPLAQLALGRELPELVVGHAAPEEIREPDASSNSLIG